MDYSLLKTSLNKLNFDENIILKPKKEFVKKINILSDNDFLKNTIFDIEKPYLKKETYIKEIMMDLIYIDGSYFPKIDNNIIESQNLNYDDFILNIYGKNFNLYLDDLKINCNLLSEDPVIFSVTYITQSFMNYDDNELKRLIEIKIYNLDKYIKYLEKNKYKFKLLADAIKKFNKRRNINCTNNDILSSNNDILSSNNYHYSELKDDYELNSDSDNENYFENFY